MTNIARYDINEGRELFLTLDPDELYLIEGTFATSYDSKRETELRYTFTDVIVRPYDLTTKFSELPVLGVISHINTIREKRGMDYSSLRKGEQFVFIGKVINYQTIAHAGINRQTFKIYRDGNPSKTLRDVCKRLRQIMIHMKTYTREEATKYHQTTIKNLDRAEDCLNNYMYIPYESSESYFHILNNAKKVSMNLWKRINEL
jgi:ATP-dependent Lon protease